MESLRLNVPGILFTKSLHTIGRNQVHFFCKTGKTCEGNEEAALSDQPFSFRRCLNPDILNPPTDYARLCAIPNASVRLRIEVNPRCIAAPPYWIHSHGLIRFPSL